MWHYLLLVSLLIFYCNINMKMAQDTESTPEPTPPVGLGKYFVYANCNNCLIKSNIILMKKNASAGGALENPESDGELEYPETGGELENLKGIKGKPREGKGMHEDIIVTDPEHENSAESNKKRIYYNG